MKYAHDPVDPGLLRGLLVAMAVVLPCELVVFAAFLYGQGWRP